jgi:hypothetical protein
MEKYHLRSNNGEPRFFFSFFFEGKKDHASLNEA